METGPLKTGIEQLSKRHAGVQTIAEQVDVAVTSS
jgi:hypothetical protein